MKKILFTLLLCGSLICFGQSGNITNNDIADTTITQQKLNLENPIAPNQAATKSYVDENFGEVTTGETTKDHNIIYKFSGKPGQVLMVTANSTKAAKGKNPCSGIWHVYTYETIIGENPTPTMSVKVVPVSEEGKFLELGIHWFSQRDFGLKLASSYKDGSIVWSVLKLH